MLHRLRTTARYPLSATLAVVAGLLTLLAHEVIAREETLVASQPTPIERCAPSPSAAVQAKACTHGPDDPTPIVEARARAAAAVAPIPDLPTRIPCTPSDGGPVIRVFYGYVGQNKLDRGVVPARAMILQAVASADRLIADAAKATGGTRHLRWYAPGCELSITPLELRGPDSFHWFGARDALYDAGLLDLQERGDRFLVVGIHDYTGITCGGQGSVFSDDSPSASNPNNQLQGLAWVDCGEIFADLAWNSGEVVAHEITHTLGGVQPTAPNPTANFHCTDEIDLMCYDDDFGGPVKMRQVCAAVVPEPIDCNKNDYFNVSPAASSYLHNHWNTANSRWMTRNDPAQWIALPQPQATPKVPAQLDRSTPIPITVQAPKGSSVTKVELLVNGVVAGSDEAAPYRVSFDPAGLKPGTVLQVKARVYDAYGRSYDSKAVRSVAAQPEVTLTTPLSYDAVIGATVRATASARAVSGAKIARVEFLVNGRVRKIDARAPYAATLPLPVSNFETSALVRARAVDSLGRMAESADVFIEIKRPSLSAGQEYVSYPANRSVVIPAYLLLDDVGLWTPPNGVVEVLIDGKVVATDAAPHSTLTAAGTAIYLPSVLMPAPDNYTMKLRFRSGAAVMAESYDYYITTIASADSITITTPAAGEVAASVPVSAAFVGGAPADSAVEFSVDGEYAGSADGPGFSTTLKLSPGPHVISSTYRSGAAANFLKGPSVVVEAPALSTNLVATGPKTIGPYFKVGATVTGVPTGWKVEQVTWYLNGAVACYEVDYKAPWRADCQLHVGQESGAAKIRAVAYLRHPNGTWFAKIVSPSLAVTARVDQAGPTPSNSAE